MRISDIKNREDAIFHAHTALLNLKSFVCLSNKLPHHKAKLIRDWVTATTTLFPSLTDLDLKHLFELLDFLQEYLTTSRTSDGSYSSFPFLFTPLHYNFLLSASSTATKATSLQLSPTQFRTLESNFLLFSHVLTQLLPDSNPAMFYDLDDYRSALLYLLALLRKYTQKTLF